jgi:UDP:flavonoid glycosyltransferase YjiC (YdhE family)
MAEPETKSGTMETPKLVFIPAIGSLGDVYPYMALALRLVKLGVRVRLGTHLRYKEIASRPGASYFSPNCYQMSIRYNFLSFLKRKNRFAMRSFSALAAPIFFSVNYL